MRFQHMAIESYRPKDDCPLHSQRLLILNKKFCVIEPRTQKE